VRDDDTIAAIATAPGRGGIGVVRVSGPAVRLIADGVLRSRPAIRSATFSKFLGVDDEVLDEGIALYFRGTQSYTGQDVLELQGHGGPLVLQRILRRCMELGARPAEPGEFTRRAYLNGKLDLAQAEAVVDLIDASTELAARCAVRGLSGDYSSRVHEVADALVELRALTEAALDFPEEEIDVSTRLDQETRLNTIRAKLRTLLSASAQGALLREGAFVVLAGQPNAGKSSLLNRLAGEDIAIVTEIPGTTRDAIRVSIDLDGMPVHVVDTAGLRDSVDPVERIGVARAWKAIGKADVVLMLVDVRVGETEADRSILERLPSRIKCIQVRNKIDLAGLQPDVAHSNDATVVSVSAKTGMGIDLLRSVLREAIGWQGGGEGVFMARERHIDAMQRADASLTQASAHGARQELFAEELRQAHEALMSITGAFTPDDLLGEIFSRFCIGK
jgi:tRNA modification GTPase